MKLAREMYFAILLDRKTAGPMMIGCSEGGTSIEDLAEKYPDKIVRIPVNVLEVCVWGGGGLYLFIYMCVCVCVCVCVFPRWCVGKKRG